MNSYICFKLADAADRSISLRLDRYYKASEEYDAHILNYPSENFPEQKRYLPYSGNGLLGVTLDSDSPIFIKNGRSLPLAVNFRPITVVNVKGEFYPVWGLRRMFVVFYKLSLLNSLVFCCTLHQNIKIIRLFIQYAIIFVFRRSFERS